MGGTSHFKSVILITIYSADVIKSKVMVIVESESFGDVIYLFIDTILS